MRLFYIQNDTGERIGLNNETGIFLTEPSGLGIEFGDFYADIGEGFFRMIAKKYTQKTVSAKLNFITDPYRKYNDFVNWCMASNKLYLIYKPLDIEYYIRTEIHTFEKSEINEYGYLEVPVNFLYLSPWYSPNSLNIPFIGYGDSAFRIDVSKLDGPDIFGNSNGLNYTAQIDPAGHLPGAFYFEYHGTAESPIITLTGIISGTEYGNCSINKSFANNTGFKLSTAYEDSYVTKILANGSEEDLLSDVDLSLEPFFKMPLTEPCIVKLEDAGALNGTLTAKINYYYRSV